jgi:hypothetical protein
VVLNVLAASAVDRRGRLSISSVVDLEVWRPPSPVSPSLFPVAGHVALEKQTEDVLTALAVDRLGKLVVTSVAGVDEWAAPVAVTDEIFPAGAQVALHKQTDGVLTALAVGSAGHLMVTSVAGLGAWQPPAPLNGGVFRPGAGLAMAKQTGDILTALAVNTAGKMMVTSVAGLENWKPLAEISDPIFPSGAAIAMAKQTEQVLTALAVDRLGKLVVMSVAGLGDWEPPAALSNEMFVPGAPVAMAKQTDGVLTALVVDTAGRLIVFSVGGLGHWEQPFALTGALFPSGAPVALHKQTDGVLTALIVDVTGRLVVTSVGGLGDWQRPVAVSDPVFVPGSAVAMKRQVMNQNPCRYVACVSGSTATKRIAQITGERDPEGFPHVNFTERWGVQGADLGANTTFNGRLFIFFGDVPGAPGQPSRPPDVDLIAHSSSANPDALRLEAVRDQDGGFHPFAISGIGALPREQTPTGAFAYGEHLYVFAFMFEHGDQNRPVSLLSRSARPEAPHDFTYVCEVSRLKFFQAAPYVVRNEDYPRLPSDAGDGLIILGHGHPNSVYLAWMPLHPGIGPIRSLMLYYRGGDPIWSASEEDAQPLFGTVAYSSLSITWIPQVKRWLVLYSDAEAKRNPNGPILARWGTTPWEWSEPTIVFEPLRDKAWGTFMHRAPCDTLNSIPPVLPPVEGWAYDGRPGWAYGAYLLSGFHSWNSEHRLLTIYYLLSTSTPYQVHVMRSQLHPPDDPTK